jgi:hypothetical protein
VKNFRITRSVKSSSPAKRSSAVAPPWVSQSGVRLVSLKRVFWGRQGHARLKRGSGAGDGYGRQVGHAEACLTTLAASTENRIHSVLPLDCQNHAASFASTPCGALARGATCLCRADADARAGRAVGFLESA